MGWRSVLRDDPENGEGREEQESKSQVLPRLPAEVNDIGVSVAKSSPDTLMYVAFFSEDNRYSRDFISNYVNNYVVDEVKRLTGVGNVQVFGDPFAMRVWLDPVRLAARGLTPLDVVGAIQDSNIRSNCKAAWSQLKSSATLWYAAATMGQ